MSVSYDQSLHEAIGWLVGNVPAPRIGELYQQAKLNTYPEVAAHLLRWADLHAESLSRLAYEDRRRHWPSLTPIHDDAYDDEPCPWEVGDERLNPEGLVRWGDGQL